MEKLTKLYKMMYGSMDSLFVNRREDFSHQHDASSLSATIAGTSVSSNSSKVSGYSSMTELSYATAVSLDSPVNQNRVSHSVRIEHATTSKAAAPEPSTRLYRKKLHHWPEESSSTNDSDSCYSDMYSVNFRTVSVHTDINHHHINEQNRPTSRLSPFPSKTLSQSTQSLPMLAHANKSSPHKGSFSDLLARKKNKKSKALEKSNQSEQKAINNSAKQLPKSVSTNTLATTSTTNEIKINSIKDLVEVLIYQLQVMERCQQQLEVQNQNLERANKIYQQKLELANRETELLKQKAAMLETEVWVCYLCSRDKIQLYSADVCVVALLCGHLFCAQCATVDRSSCPKCGQRFTIDRRVHL